MKIILKILQWNILENTPEMIIDYVPLAAGNALWEKRSARIEQILKVEDPDIISLCEVMEDSQPKLDPNAYFTYFHKKADHNQGTFVAIKKMKLNVTSFNTTFFPTQERVGVFTDLDAVMNQNYIKLTVSLRRTSVKFVLLSTHLKAGSKDSSVALRSVHLQYIKDLFINTQDPLLIMGDFNAPPTDKRMKEFITDMKLNSFEAKLPTAYKWKHQIYPYDCIKKSADMISISHPYKFSEVKLDYVLYPQKWQLKKHPTKYRPGAKDAAPGDRIYPNENCPSDHIPLIGHFELNSKTRRWMI